MIEKYLTLELVFLVPLLLAVAIPICRRRAPTELRFLWSAVGITLGLVVGNVAFAWLGIKAGFPAAAFFLMLIVGYTIFPSIIGSCASAVVGGIAATAASAAAAAYSDSHVGSFADRYYHFVVWSVALLVGVVATCGTQWMLKQWIAQRANQSLDQTADRIQRNS
ncbi:MAG: hypothetical protein WCJ18_00490 [Planctomycetota bacterium]